MTYVMNRGDGIYDIPIGDPCLTRDDGKVRANLSTVLSDSWTSAERRRFGVFDVQPTAIPEGFRAIRTAWEPLDNGDIHEVHIIERPAITRLGRHRIGADGVRIKGRIKVARTN